MRTIRPLPLTFAIADHYADVRRVLRPAGQLIGDVDLLIAATAIHHKLTIVTADSDYQRVAGLQLLLVQRDTLR